MTVICGFLICLFFIIFYNLRRNKFYYLYSILLIGISFFIERYLFSLPTFSKISFIIVILLHLILINFITFLMYYLDKKAAKKKSWRISEESLHTFEVIGGTPAAFIAQKLFRHKTKKQAFKLQYWLIVLFQIIFIFILLKK